MFCVPTCAAPRRPRALFCVPTCAAPRRPRGALRATCQPRRLPLHVDDNRMSAVYVGPVFAVDFAILTSIHALTQSHTPIHTQDTALFEMFHIFALFCVPTCAAPRCPRGTLRSACGARRLIYTVLKDWNLNDSTRKKLYKLPRCRRTRMCV